MTRRVRRRPQVRTGQTRRRPSAVVFPLSPRELDGATRTVSRTSTDDCKSKQTQTKRVNKHNDSNRHRRGVRAQKRGVVAVRTLPFRRKCRRTPHRSGTVADEPLGGARGHVVPPPNYSRARTGPMCTRVVKTVVFAARRVCTCTVVLVCCFFFFLYYYYDYY